MPKKNLTFLMYKPLADICVCCIGIYACEKMSAITGFRYDVYSCRSCHRARMLFSLC